MLQQVVEEVEQEQREVEEDSDSWKCFQKYLERLGQEEETGFLLASRIWLLEEVEVVEALLSEQQLEYQQNSVLIEQTLSKFFYRFYLEENEIGLHLRNISVRKNSKNEKRLNLPFEGGRS